MTQDGNNEIIHNSAETSANITRRAMLASLAPIAAVFSGGGKHRPNIMDMLTADIIDPMEGRALAIYALAEHLGASEGIRYCTADEICWFIFDADDLILQVLMLREDPPMFSHLTDQDSIIPKNELAKLVAVECGFDSRGVTWDAANIREILETADRLLVERFILEEEEKRKSGHQ